MSLDIFSQSHATVLLAALWLELMQVSADIIIVSGITMEMDINLSY